MGQATHVTLAPGDPAPWFNQNSSIRPDLGLQGLASRYVVLCFYGSASDDRGRTAIETALANPGLFDGTRISFFGVSTDPQDESKRNLRGRLGVRFVWDWDLSVSRLYGAVPKDSRRGQGLITMRRFWIVLDPTLRVLELVPFEADGSDISQVLAYLERLPPPDCFAGIELQAPILYLPNVFEADLCRQLIELHERNAGEDSAYVREVDGMTVRVMDRSFKRRKDYNVEDPELMARINARIVRRICSEIIKVHHVKPTNIERYTIGCYSSEDGGGHFLPHRDNISKATAHRQFAISINLNADFEGGLLRFPEYGPKGFKPPIGGAVVFSCSLLHEATKVTKGRRYAFLPFVFDDESQRLRQTNNRFLDLAAPPLSS
jgi:peroxiredoxin/predicted 2-oxoglutarate/Fe(II)-dependent dioxygenase YbiX